VAKSHMPILAQRFACGSICLFGRRTAQNYSEAKLGRGDSRGYL